MDNDGQEKWKWSYNRWVGVMYGPIPIGLIIAIPLLLWLATKR